MELFGQVSKSINVYQIYLIRELHDMLLFDFAKFLNKSDIEKKLTRILPFARTLNSLRY